jgi:hypothetical protein
MKAIVYHEDRSTEPLEFPTRGKDDIGEDLGVYRVHIYGEPDGFNIEVYDCVPTGSAVPEKYQYVAIVWNPGTCEVYVFETRLALSRFLDEMLPAIDRAVADDAEPADPKRTTAEAIDGLADTFGSLGLDLSIGKPLLDVAEAIKSATAMGDGHVTLTLDDEALDLLRTLTEKIGVFVEASGAETEIERLRQEHEALQTQAEETKKATKALRKAKAKELTPEQKHEAEEKARRELFGDA